MIKRFLAWWRNRDTEIGRAGVRINRCPHVSANGSLCWNVRDIIFKPDSQAETGSES